MGKMPHTLRKITMKKPVNSEKHQQRMSKVKEQIDKKIAQADKEQGVSVLLTGNGKGKSSSAFGMLARSLGYGHNCAVVQFIKGEWECGEELFLANCLWFPTTLWGLALLGKPRT